MVGQVLNFEFNEHRHKKEWMEQVVRDTLPGSICYDNCSDEFSEWVRGIAEKYCRIPMMYVGDGEHGSGCGAPNEPVLPKPMAWGAADEPEAVERAHRISAQLCRKHYRHLLLGPVVDINYNYNNCVVNVRAISDDPDVVARNAAAAVQSGDLPMERLQDAVLRIWRMKNAVGLFGEAEQIHAKLETEPIEDINQWGRELAEHSVTVIRNAKGLFPQRDLKPGSKVLQVVIQHDVGEKHAADQMRFVEDELRVHGMEVTTLVNPKHYDVKDAAEKYDVALLNININPGNYQGGTLRIG